MITISTSTGGKSVMEELENYGKKVNAKKIAEIVEDDLRRFSQSKGWVNIASSIKSYKIDNNTAEVRANEKKSKEGVPYSSIIHFQNVGTKAHGPVNAKVLHWKQGRKDIWAMWVRGITPTNFFKITNLARAKIKEFIKNIGRTN